jgi:hypothetical protein
MFLGSNVRPVRKADNLTVIFEPHWLVSGLALTFSFLAYFLQVFLDYVHQMKQMSCIRLRIRRIFRHLALVGLISLIRIGVSDSRSVLLVLLSRSLAQRDR